MGLGKRHIMMPRLRAGLSRVSVMRKCIEVLCVLHGIYVDDIFGLRIKLPRDL